MSFRRLLRIAETLLIALIGGVIMNALGLPAGFVSGSVLAVAAASLLGRPTAVPPNLVRVVLVVIGIALGSVVTPATLAALTAYPASIALVAVGTLAIMGGTALYLHLVHGWSRFAAVLGGSPGALSQVMALSADTDVNVAAITVVQTVRVTLLAAGLPIALSLLGLAAQVPVPSAAFNAAGLGDLAILVAVATAGGFLLTLLRFPGSWVFGAMMGSAIMHGGGFTTALLPAPVTAAAMMAIGAVTGSRFSGTPPRLLTTYLAAALGSFAVSLLIAGLFIVGSVWLVETRAADTAIAYAPGAQETMMLLALGLRLDPVFVASHHLARFVVVSLAVAAFAAILLRRPGMRRPTTDDGPGR